MVVTPAQRRLLVVDPCDDCHGLLPGLRTAGWEVDSCALEAVGDRSCDLGLLRLQPYHLERPEAVKELIGRSGTEWIAVLSQDVLRLQNVGDGLRCCHNNKLRKVHNNSFTFPLM